MGTAAKPSQLRLQVEPHRYGKQDQERKSILVSDEESDSFLTRRCYHKEGETLFVALDARYEMWLHLERNQYMIRSLLTR